MKTLKKLFLFNYTQCNALKEYLEEMALSGWILKDINVFLVFEKGKPEKLTYAVEVFEKASIFDTRLEKNAKEYVEYCSYAQWEFVCSTEKIHIFVSREENPIPIQTDERIKYQIIKKSMLKKNAFLWFAIPLIYTYNFLFDTYSEFDYFITSYISLFIALLLVIYCTKTSINIISFFAWCNKAKKSLLKGQSLPYFSKRDLQRVTLIEIMPLLLSFFTAVIIGVLSFLNKDYYSATYIFLILFALIIMLSFIIRINKIKAKRIDNISYQIALGIFLAVFPMVFIFFSVFFKDNPKMVFDRNGIAFLGRSEVPITLEDVGISIGKHRDTKIEKNETIFAKSTVYQENTRDRIGGDNIGIKYEIFESRYKFILDKVIRSKLEMRGKNYKEGDVSKWLANSVFIEEGGYGHFTMVVYEEFIFSYWSTEPLNDNSIVKIREKLIDKKLNNSL